jgi:hypothetical protein
MVKEELAKTGPPLHEALEAPPPPPPPPRASCPCRRRSCVTMGGDRSCVTMGGDHSAAVPKSSETRHSVSLCFVL